MAPTDPLSSVRSRALRHRADAAAGHDDGRVQWGNAGHPPPILVREHRVAQRLVAPTTLPVGLGGSEPRVSELGLAPGTESSASPTE
ncbi:regulatory phosphatase [Streptomyces bottropensis ATCC 25435]|uniref:Regulatory phosphatase n=1 Tax=Streptomyces bottropensis ATCC 25435 TaxID=1054862 RepID=M3FDQ9_9ACTN|nr:regulatory phosphatase [Streptomyces bottropensis ATCC 25435]